jgi:hypothetical protein
MIFVPSRLRPRVYASEETKKLALSLVVLQEGNGSARVESKEPKRIRDD